MLESLAPFVEEEKVFTGWPNLGKLPNRQVLAKFGGCHLFTHLFTSGISSSAASTFRR